MNYLCVCVCVVIFLFIPLACFSDRDELSFPAELQKSFAAETKTPRVSSCRKKNISRLKMF